jgi:hypothetical protein
LGIREKLHLQFFTCRVVLLDRLSLHRASTYAKTHPKVASPLLALESRLDGEFPLVRCRAATNLTAHLSEGISHPESSIRIVRVRIAAAFHDSDVIIRRDILQHVRVTDIVQVVKH